MRSTLFTERERLAIVQGLYRMRAELPGPIWVTDLYGHSLTLDIGTLAAPLRRVMTWRQAERIVNGEDWRQVICPVELSKGIRRINGAGDKVHSGNLGSSQGARRKQGRCA